MISTGVLRAVNPVSLAEASGVTKVPRFANPIPPVIRPQLLTTQLMGCCVNCAGDDHAGPVGLTGFIPPDYGSLRNGGSYGIFKMMSSEDVTTGPAGGPWAGGPTPKPSPSMGYLGKGATGTHAADYNTRWTSNRGLGKGAVGNNAATYATRLWAHGLRGLGLGFADTYPVPSAGSGNTSVLNAVAAGASFIPGVGPIAGISVQALTQFIKQLGSWLGIGKGRQEADLIVPVQNQMMAQLGTVTNQFITGTSPSIATLQQLYVQVWTLAVGFQEFVLQKTFTDRRASGQALNTVMPYIDGTAGYAVPVGPTATPSQSNTMHWGAGSIGGDGTDGMLGALSRAIKNLGGQAPVLMNLHQAANSGIPPQQAAATNVATGQPSLIPASALMTPVVGGLSLQTVLLIGLGILVLSRLK